MRYEDSGVNVKQADLGISNIVSRIKSTWNKNVLLDIGYFSNVVKIGKSGIAITTDGVGSKTIIASMMKKYNTIGIDCIAMNVNDLICVGASPTAFVDYIAVDKVDSDMLDQIAIGLTEGANQAGVPIVGGEVSQLPGIVTGFDLVGTAIGMVDKKYINTGQNIVPGDIVIGIESNGLHSNGYSLARKVLLNGLASLETEFGFEDSENLGEELLRPTTIYVAAIEDLDVHLEVKGYANITGDGLLNLNRFSSNIGFNIHSLPKPQLIFDLIQHFGNIESSEMYSTFNMGVGFCVVVSPSDVQEVIDILKNDHELSSCVIGEAVADPEHTITVSLKKDSVRKKETLIGKGKKFWK